MRAHTKQVKHEKEYRCAKVVRTTFENVKVTCKCKDRKNMPGK
jgi:hypothetical protein